MREYHFTKNDINFVRISKAAARRLYNAGKCITLCPANLRPDSPWGVLYETLVGDKDKEGFDNLVTSFAYYNCVDHETGKYPAFYADEALL